MTNEKYRILKYGIYSALFYWTITLLLIKIIDGAFLLFSFYFPGTLFGVFLTIAFSTNKKADPAILPIISTLIYALVIFISSKNIPELIHVRQILSPGIGSFLLLFSISKIYSLKVSAMDYILAFGLAILTTFYSWEGENNFINPWKLFIAIGIWQITFASYLTVVLNKRIKHNAS